MPPPRSSRINSVSAWSSRVCAVRICVAPLLRAACASRRQHRACAAAGNPVFGFSPSSAACGGADQGSPPDAVARFLCCLGPQAVIDGDGDQLRPRASACDASAQQATSTRCESGPPETASTIVGAAFQSAKRRFCLLHRNRGMIVGHGVRRVLGFRRLPVCDGAVVRISPLCLKGRGGTRKIHHLYNWGAVDRWTAEAHLYLGHVNELKISAPIETFGDSASVTNVYSG